MAPVATATEAGKVGEAAEATGAGIEAGVATQEVGACTAAVWAVEEVRRFELWLGEFDALQTGILLAPDVG